MRPSGAPRANTSRPSCGRAISDAAAHGTITMFGGKHDKLWALMVNMSHDAEQYGNLLPYLRMNGLIPPSSKPGKS